jgi:hypothetical protein
MKPLVYPLLLGLLLFTLAGCQKPRNLKLTEIGTNRVEIFLDEPGDHSLNLASVNFTWISQDSPGASPRPAPTRGDVSLGLVGSLQGQQYLVIFEDPSYQGPPVAQDFRTGTPGIKVRDSFFPGYGNDPGVSMNVNGSRSGTAVLFIPTTETVSDTLGFGDFRRPALAGTFRDGSALDGVKPQGGRSISRRFSSGAPVDTDSGIDWSLQPESIGIANP